MQDIVEGYKKQASTDDIFDLLQGKYPLDAELLDRQQQQIQNIPKSGNDAMIATPPTSQTSLDMYIKMQATQFQVLQQMTQVLENNNKLIGELITLVKNQQTLPEKPAIKSGVKRKTARPKQKIVSQPKKQAQKKKGFFSFLRK
jgi:hypothetical protein